MSNATTVTQGQDVFTFRNVMLLRAMEFELRHGSPMCRENPFQIVRKEFGISKRRKADVASAFRRVVEAAQAAQGG